MTIDAYAMRARTWRLQLWCVLALAPVLATACTAGPSLLQAHPSELAPGVKWFAPTASRDVEAHARWRASVGPPIRVETPALPARADRLLVISWNVALGEGNVEKVVREQMALHPGLPIVLLLQEAFRGGPEVPAVLQKGHAFAGRLGGPASTRHQVQAVASALNLSLCYVPSMRNGSPADSDEDRGNAILSSLPLTDLTAIELPFERQRRVAVSGTVSGLRSDGTPWSLRVVSAHLDNNAGARRAWVGSELARKRQARGLAAMLEGQSPTLLAGDFNTWFGFSDAAYAETLPRFPDTRVTDTRRTFMGVLRLDHMFFRLPPGWRAEFHRGAERYGSDHYPLIATIEIG